MESIQRQYDNATYFDPKTGTQKNFPKGDHAKQGYKRATRRVPTLSKDEEEAGSVESGGLSVEDQTHPLESLCFTGQGKSGMGTEGSYGGTLIDGGSVLDQSEVLERGQSYA